MLCGNNLKNVKYINFCHSKNEGVRKPNGMARDESSELLHCSLSSNFLNIFSVPLSYRNVSETDVQDYFLN